MIRGTGNSSVNVGKGKETVGEAGIATREGEKKMDRPS
jgi:hypothetical protein